MVRVIMHGCNGHMGRAVSDLCAETDEMEIVAGVDIDTTQNYGYPVYDDIGKCAEEADVIIDFSTASCIDALIAHCLEKKMPVVLCTTGLSEEQEKALWEATKEVAILKSANMSLGINTLLELLGPAAQALAGAGFDVEIIEKHHNRKLDAPSGTALMLADAVNGAMNDAYDYKLDRSGERKERGEYEIGIQSIRGGNIVGEHEVLFCGTDEIVSLKHVANSRSIFAKGALAAANFLAGKPAGFYDMSDVIHAG